jgi:competence ComEA-like helix-hairpin-helix protein
MLQVKGLNIQFSLLASRVFRSMAMSSLKRNGAMHYPGFGIVAVFIALLLCAATWRAIHRTVIIDHAANANAPAHANMGRTLPDMRIDINSASAAELALLPGIGPALAERIVADRDARGQFETVDSLDRVKGIGTAIIERVRPHCVAVVSTMER